jgi:hypothetical protein
MTTDPLVVVVVVVVVALLAQQYPSLMAAIY